jgi:hypothetical protein
MVHHEYHTALNENQNNTTTLHHQLLSYLKRHICKDKDIDIVLLAINRRSFFLKYQPKINSC